MPSVAECQCELSHNIWPDMTAIISIKFAESSGKPELGTLAVAHRTSASR
jgi:hypothetical protein